MSTKAVFNSIKTIFFAVTNDAPNTQGEMINYQTGLAFGVSKSSGADQDARIAIKHSVTISNRPEEGQPRIQFGQIVTESLFNLPNIASYFIPNFGYKFPKDIMIPLLEAAVSTARGIALTRGAGTLLDTMPIPLIDGAESLENIETVDVPIPQHEAVEAGLVSA